MRNPLRSQKSDRLQHGLPAGNDIVEENGRSITDGGHVRRTDRYAPVAMADFLQSRIRRIDVAGGFGNPLRTFFVRADEEWIFHMRGDPGRDGRRRMHGGDGNLVKLSQRFVAVQMRIDGHQPVEILRYQGRHRA